MPLHVRVGADDCELLAVALLLTEELGVAVPLPLLLPVPDALPLELGVVDGVAEELGVIEAVPEEVGVIDGVPLLLPVPDALPLELGVFVALALVLDVLLIVDVSVPLDEADCDDDIVPLGVEEGEPLADRDSLGVPAIELLDEPECDDECVLEALPLELGEPLALPVVLAAADTLLDAVREYD